MLATQTPIRSHTKAPLPTIPLTKRARGILVVDDDEAVRTVLSLFFRRHGLPVWLAADGAEAISIYRNHADAIAMILLNVYMLGMDGPQTLVRLREIKPKLSCYFMSGDYTPYTEDELVANGTLGVVIKPFLLKMLGPIVHDCLTAPA